MMRKLLKLGANPDLGEVHNFSVVNTPLLRVIEWTDHHALEAVQVLVAAHASIDQVDQYGYSPLLRAVERSEKEVVQFLLSHGADMTMRSPAGKSLLEIAASKRSVWPQMEAEGILTRHAIMLEKLHGTRPPAQGKVLGLYTMPVPLWPSMPLPLQDAQPTSAPTDAGISTGTDGSVSTDTDYDEDTDYYYGTDADSDDDSDGYLYDTDSDSD
jgi:hypothetical protein